MGAPELSEREYGKDKRRLTSGFSTVPVADGPDFFAGKIEQLNNIGLAGKSIGVVNFVDESYYFIAKVLPRLERLGLCLARQ